MSDPTPAPNSPEALAKAAKVKSYFMLIVGVNLALIAIALWPRGEAKPAPVPAVGTLAPGSQHDLELLLDNALTDYNSLEGERFLRFFSTAAQPPADAAFFDRVIKGIYHHEFGAVFSKKLIPGETSLDADYGMLVYEAQCKKRPAVKLSVNFQRDSGVLKIVQWRMEKL